MLAASASFGARRDFMLRCNDDKAHKLRFPLGAGDVLVMSGATQACAAAVVLVWGLRASGTVFDLDHIVAMAPP